MVDAKAYICWELSLLYNDIPVLNKKGYKMNLSGTRIDQRTNGEKGH